MKRVLVAGIGNIFFGDDAFGCEVAAALVKRPQPAGVHIEDFGIRSFDLAYALMDCEAAILIDAVPHGEKPGTLVVLEPDTPDFNETGTAIDAHTMNPVRVLQMVRFLGGEPPRLRLVGCEPDVLESENGRVGLSEPVRAALPDAIALVEELIAEILNETAAASPQPAAA